FSSRRRHTRLQGDWSSDVCSSDLFRDGADLVVLDGTLEAFRAPSAGVTNIAINGGGGNDSIRVAPSVTQPVTIDGGPGNNKAVRSEERRVGKEGRERGSPDRRTKS